MTWRQVLSLGGRLALGVLLLAASGCGDGGSRVGGGSPGDDVVSSSPQPSGSSSVGPGVNGRVTDPEGTPIVLASLTVVDGPSGAGPVTQQALVTDAAGHYFMRLSPGRWTVEVSAADFHTARFSVDVTRSGTASKDVVLRPAAG